MSKLPYAIATLTAITIMVASITTLHAGPPGHAKHGWKHQEGYDDDRGWHGKPYRDGRGRHYRVLRRGGPPPWAPAHGYRRKYVTYRTHDHRMARIEESRLVSLPEVGAARCNRDVVGAIFGGAAGAVVGSRFGKGDSRTAVTVGGAILGALIGGSLGRAMDQADQNCVGQALERAETGRPVAWQNPSNGLDYEVTPTRTYQADDGAYCREYTATIVIDGRERNAYGTACRRPDGSWQRQG